MQTYPGYTRKANYYETDQMAIIHHSNYIRWFEEARVDFLDSLNLSYQTIEQAGIIVPVLEVTCKYKEMVHFGETVRIDLFIENYTGTRLNFRYEIYNQKDQLVTLGESKHCFLSKANNRLISLKKSYPDFHRVFQGYADKNSKK